MNLGKTVSKHYDSIIKITMSNFIKKYRLQSIILISAFLGFSFTFSSCKEKKKQYFPDSTWRVSTPEEQGVDSKKIYEMLQYIQSSKLDFHSILIIKNGYIITEAYWAPYNDSITHDIKSASKGIISTLVGIALDKGYLNNLNQKVSEFYPEYVKDSLKQSITLHNLLTMTGGLDWKEDSGLSPYDLYNWNKIPSSGNPGEIFEYNTTMTHMMSAILTKATGESTKDFADDFLFGPLGIKNYYWTKGKDGIYHGGSDIFMTPRDMAKIGYLYLKNGQWNEKQIVPKEWVEESTTKKVNIPSEDTYAKGLNYGYWWWLQEKGYMAWGAGGQYIIVRPDLDLVVVITSNGFDNINRYSEFMKSFLEVNIISALNGNAPLPSSPRTLQKINDFIKELKEPKEKSNSLIPDIAMQISNTNYSLEQNKIGFKNTSLTFKNSNECVWRYSIGGQSVHLQVGINGIYKINEIPFSMGVRPDGESIACKGQWTNNEIFVIEHHIIGDPSKQIFEFSFNKDEIDFKISGFGQNTLIKGTKEK